MIYRGNPSPARLTDRCRADRDSGYLEALIDRRTYQNIAILVALPLLLLVFSMIIDVSLDVSNSYSDNAVRRDLSARTISWEKGTRIIPEVTISRSVNEQPRFRYTSSTVYVLEIPILRMYTRVCKYP